MTDLSTLALPAWAVPTSTREDGVVNQRIEIPDLWWQAQLSARSLPGTPPTGSALTRASVWAGDSDDFSLLWRTLAWGSGFQLRLNIQRLDSIATDLPRARKILTEAREAVGDPKAAYALLRSGKHNAIRWFGPSFFTKFLYFAGGGEADHPCLILDQVVATKLHDHCGWTSLVGNGPWPDYTYQRYCDLLARWAGERGCARDQIEHSLFKHSPPARA
jgi:hypothetical protein